MLTSSMLPTETKCEKPMPSSIAQSSTEVHKAPDWEMKPTRPGRAIPAANVALSPPTGFMIPRQFGPITRMP